MNMSSRGRKASPTQRERVAALLQARGPVGLTPVDFLAPNVVDLGQPITRLAPRILELREQGWNIATVETSPVARYVLTAAPEAAAPGPAPTFDPPGRDPGHLFEHPTRTKNPTLADLVA